MEEATTMNPQLALESVFQMKQQSAPAIYIMISDQTEYYSTF